MNDIEEIQKTPPILPVKYPYWDCRFRNAAKIATPGVVNIKSLLNLKGNNIKMSFLIYPIKRVFSKRSFIQTI
jgi:hypothetical protein